jgi:cytochrome c oxidase cbb3-type subunit 3
MAFKSLMAAGLCALACMSAASAQKFNAAAVQRGKEVFGPNCGFCHGLTARGGDGGPDLARSLFVLSDEKGQQLGDLLKTGRGNMPAFSNMSPAQVTDMAEFLHERVEAARNREGSTPPNIVVGDAKAGQAYFNGAGKCSGCHSVTGDLKGVGAKYEPVALQDKFLSPRSGGGRGRGPVNLKTVRTVRVTPQNGTAVSGTLIMISDFAVTLRDAAGQRVSFTREGDVPKVEIIDPLQAHLNQLLTLTDKDIHNLTAYMVTLK